jgi:hypothetical protein
MAPLTRSTLLAAGLLAFPLAGAVAQAVVDDTGTGKSAPGVAPGATTDAGKTGVGPRGTKVAPSTEPSEAPSTTTSTTTGRPPGVPEGTTAAQLPTNTSEAKSQPPTTAVKPKGP